MPQLITIHEERVQITNAGRQALRFARGVGHPDGRGGCSQCGAPERDCLCCPSCGADQDDDHEDGCPDAVDEGRDEVEPATVDEPSWTWSATHDAPVCLECEAGQRGLFPHVVTASNCAAAGSLAAASLMAGRITAASAALAAVAELWQSLDHTGDFYADAYPFESDLSEVAAQVLAWAESVRRDGEADPCLYVHDSGDRCVLDWHQDGPHDLGYDDRSPQS